MLKRDISLMLILSSIIACNNNVSESTTKVDTSKVTAFNQEPDSIQSLPSGRDDIFSPDSIYGNWSIEIMHSKNSCDPPKVEHSSSGIWRIYRSKGKIRINEIIASITGLGEPNEATLNQNHLEIKGNRKDNSKLDSEEFITVTGSVEFSDSHSFSGTMKEVASQNCITTYKVYGSKNQNP